MLYALSSLILCSLIMYCSTLISKIIEFPQILQLMFRISTQHATPLSFDYVLFYDIRHFVFDLWLRLELVKWFVYWLYLAFAGHIDRLCLWVVFKWSFGVGSWLFLINKTANWSIFVSSWWDASPSRLFISAQVGSWRNFWGYSMD